MTDFKQDDEITPVIFRREGDGGKVIALLFEEPGTDDPLTCSSCVHVLENHKSVDPQHVIKDTRAATSVEYADLKTEMESVWGYRIRVCYRLPPRSLAVRRAKLKALAERAPILDDTLAAVEMREWLQATCEAKGAKVTGNDVGCGQADIDVELDGRKFNISIRPIKT